jgi:L-asparagine transporter-like permease
MRDDFWFYLLAAMILLITGTRAALIFKKYKTKYNLVTLTINIIGFVGIILAYFYPAGEWLHVKDESKILILIAFLIILFVSLFFGEIKQFLDQRKTRKK